MNTTIRRCSVVALLFATWVFGSKTVSADDSLPARIDALIAAAEKQPLAPRTTDAEFLRRLYLRLAGRVPSLDEARRFFADVSADKRNKLIDELLAGPDYPRAMEEAFDAILIERRPLHPRLGERAGHEPEWRAFLHDAFANNKPWDRMVHDVLCPNPQDEKTRGAAFFYTRRLETWGQVKADYPGVTRDVGRLFLGVDLQCAECHDHLFIGDYKQLDFQGLAAFFAPMGIGGNAKFPSISEKPVQKKVEFVSALTKEKQETAPRLPSSAAMEIAAASEPPARGRGRGRGGPPASSGPLESGALAFLAEELPSADNRAFASNAANRFWWLMMGRGLVEPMDLSYSGNPPSHPELLELLTDELISHQFDIKWFLGQLARSETYQRSTLLPPGIADLPAASFASYHERPLSAEQWFWGLMVATGEFQRRKLTPAAASKPDEELSALRAEFVMALGNAPKVPETTIVPSAQSALFLLNNATVDAWLQPRDGNLTDRSNKISDTAALAEELYLATLSRPASEQERANVSALLAEADKAGRRQRAIQNLAWSLLASPEFGTNR